MGRNNFYAIDSYLKIGDGLERRELGSLLESAVKFFLFQRTQIPVPFESLYSGSDPDMLTEGVTPPDPNPAEPEAGEESENPFERIRMLKEKRKRMGAKRRHLINTERTRRQEISIKSQLEAGFKVFRNVIESPHLCPEELIGIVLMFGPAVVNPKETIIFQIHPDITNKSAASSPCLESDAQSSASTAKKSSLILRQFYQSIICTQAFPEFTANPLTRTYTYLGVLTLNPLEASVMNENDLTHLEDFVLPYVERWAEPSKVDNDQLEPDSPPLLRQRVLNVSLRPPTVALRNVHSECSAPSAIPGNSSTLCHLTQPTYNCYQIPLAYKGVQWLKKLKN